MKNFLSKYKYYLLISLLILLLCCKAVSFLYFENPYKPENFSLKQINTTQSEVKVSENKDYFEISPLNESPINREKGVIFYPGGRVKPESYIAHMVLISKAANVKTFILKVPLNYAIFDINAAEKVIADKKEISKWYIGGHSLGGVAASYNVSSQQNNENIKGLFLWASYPANKSLANNQRLSIVGIYGGKDAFVTKEDIETAKTRLPKDTQFTTLDGVTHSQFGDYGKQKGDNDPDISNDIARQKIVEAMVTFINK